MVLYFVYLYILPYKNGQVYLFFSHKHKITGTRTPCEKEKEMRENVFASGATKGHCPTRLKREEIAADLNAVRQ